MYCAAWDWFLRWFSRMILEQVLINGSFQFQKYNARSAHVSTPNFDNAYWFLWGVSYGQLNHCQKNYYISMIESFGSYWGGLGIEWFYNVGALGWLHFLKYLRKMYIDLWVTLLIVVFYHACRITKTAPPCLLHIHVEAVWRSCNLNVPGHRKTVLTQCYSWSNLTIIFLNNADYQKLVANFSSAWRAETRTWIGCRREILYSMSWGH